MGAFPPRKVLFPMIHDLQKASLLKRLSAYILDKIMLLVLITGVAFVLSGLLGLDGYSQTLSESYTKYETQFGVSLDITQEEYDALPEAERQVYDAAYEAMNGDEKAVQAYNMVINLTLTIITCSILLGYLGLELLVPLLFGNGQTVGKKVFGIGLMKTSGVKINAISLFIRTVLGKFAVETMIPVLMLLMMFLGTIGIVGPAVVLGIVLVQIVLMITSHTNSLIHDTLAQTVAVDLSSQLIFGSESELMAHKQRLHEEMVKKKPY